MDELQKQLAAVDAAIAADKATIDAHRATWRHQCANGLLGAASETELAIVEVGKNLLRLDVQREAVQEKLNQQIRQQRQAAAERHVSASIEQLNNIEESLASIDSLLAGIESQVVTMRTNATCYAEAAHFAKLNGSKVAPFSSSTAYGAINDLTIKLKLASQQVGGIAGELVRRAP